MRAGITFFVSGCLLIVFAASMLLPAALDLADGQTASAKAFTFSATLTFFFGVLFLLTFYDKYEKLSVREMYLTTSLVWAIVCAFSALPFYFSPLPQSYTDSFFEAMSGLTTMGATIYRDIDIQPRGIILWRAILQWIGGLGIIVIALGILPMLRIGGMQLFLMENSDKSGKKLPKTSKVIGTLMMIYTTLTILCILFLCLSGMSVFDSIAYSMTTIPTGGLAPKNTSAADISNQAQWIITFFMFISGMPLFMFYSLFKKDYDQIKGDLQIKTYLYFYLFISALMTLWLKVTHPDIAFFDALRHMMFNLASTISSTGFTSCNIEAWGMFAIIFFTFLLPIGACSGSTSGGIKMFRFNIIYLFSVKYLRHKLLPHAVIIEKYNGKPLTEEITSGVFVFIAIFLMSFLISALLLGLMGLDLLTIISGLFSAFGNTGIAFGPIIGASGNFANLPEAAKWILSVDMMLGRLEFITVFVVLLPLAWRTEKKTVETTSF